MDRADNVSVFTFDIKKLSKKELEQLFVNVVVKPTPLIKSDPLRQHAAEVEIEHEMERRGIIVDDFNE